MAQLFDTSTPRDAIAYAHVAPEQGIDAGPNGLTYAVPAAIGEVRVGERVTVPLGRGDKQVTGYVLDVSPTCDLPPAKLAKVKPIVARDPHAVSLTPDLIELARWMANYYCCPLGMVLVTMLPAAVKHGTGAVQRVMVRVVDEGGDEVVEHAVAQMPEAATEKLHKLTTLQRTILSEAKRLRDEGEPWIEMRELADAGGARTISPVKQLIAKGLLISETRWAVRADVRAPGEDEAAADNDPTAMPPIVLTPAQDRAIERLSATIADGFNVHLLHGVTGSGKTEVYLRVIEHLLRGIDSPSPADSTDPPRGAIVLVPEIALTPQTVARFKHRFAGDGVAVLHSGLTASQRHDQWQRIRRGEARIVVGARSAVFAPLPRVGLIIVDEEHESSYKQDQLPRYHARDVAIKRGQMLDAPVLLGSATPSLESYYNAVDPSRKRPYHLLELPERVAGLTLPRVQIVDMTAERRKRYEYSGRAGIHLLSIALETQLRETLKAGGQVMLLLNRRGYANYIACPDHRCGWLMHCEHCDTTMVYHRNSALPTGGYVMCHHCGAEQLLPFQCPQCTKKITTFGLGTQRVEEEIERKFAGVTFARMDSDSMRTGHDYHATLARFRRGAIDILVGTQMIAKGLDFPNVRLVGVISADTALHMPDFRAAERTFQLIAQVAGRAGRGADGGRVVVQTFNPDDPNILLAAKHDYRGFAMREIELRRSVGLPPVTRMARIVVRDRDLVACTEQAHKLAKGLREFNDELKLEVRLRGPTPCPIARIAEFHRMQIEMIAADASRLQRLMTALRNARLLKSDAHTAVDVDPVAML